MNQPVKKGGSMKRANSLKLKGDAVHLGLAIERGLHEKIKQLAESVGVSVNFAVRRALIEMVNTGAIPLPGQIREEEQAELQERPQAYDIQAQRLSDLEHDFQRLQAKIAAIRGTTNTTPVFSGHRTGAGPKRQIDRRTKQAAPLE